MPTTTKYSYQGLNIVRTYKYYKYTSLRVYFNRSTDGRKSHKNYGVELGNLILRLLYCNCLIVVYKLRLSEMLAIICINHKHIWSTIKFKIMYIIQREYRQN